MPGDGTRQVGLSISGYTLVYDGDCAFCRRFMALLSRWDRKSLVRQVPFQDGAALQALPALDRRALEEAMHLVTPNGRTFVGAAAVPVLLHILPGGWALAWVFRLPGVPWLAAKAYRLVARNRHRLGCGSATCTLGGPRG